MFLHIFLTERIPYSIFWRNHWDFRIFNFEKHAIFIKKWYRMVPFPPKNGTIRYHFLAKNLKITPLQSWSVAINYTWSITTNQPREVKQWKT